MSVSNAHIVFCWELGGGLGHLVPLIPVAAALSERGCRITIASRDCASARKLFSGINANICVAPYGGVDSSSRIDYPSNYAHVLHNNGWNRIEQLETLVHGWRKLFHDSKASFVLCDHSPTALLAAHTLSLPAATFGTGFCCPPNRSPLPTFRANLMRGQSDNDPVELALLDRMNAIMSGFQKESFKSFADLLHHKVSQLLTTFHELDHYPSRELTRYRGAWSKSRGTDPRWPRSGAVSRAIAYIKPYPHLSELLSMLVYHNVSLLVYCPGLDAKTKERFSAQERISFSDDPVDLDKALVESDFAVLNSGHGSTVAALRAGKPTLQLPLNMEQAITAARCGSMGASETIDVAHPLEYSCVVENFLKKTLYDHRVQEFADRYRDYDERLEIDLIADEVQQSVEPNARRTWAGFRGKKQEMVIGLSPSRRMLSEFVSRFSATTSTAIQFHGNPLLPWTPSKHCESELARRFSTLMAAFPSVSLVGDAAISYLPYVKLIASMDFDISFVYLHVTKDFLISEYLQIFAMQPENAFNHWSIERTGFDDHALDAAYPKYETRDVVSAITRFHKEYVVEAESLSREFADIFRIVPEDEISTLGKSL